MGYLTCTYFGVKLNGLPLEPYTVGRPKLGLQLTCRFRIKVPKKVPKKVPTNVPTKITVPINGPD